MEFTGRKLKWDPYVTAKRELRARVSKSACDAVDERMKKPLSGGACQPWRETRKVPAAPPRAAVAGGGASERLACGFSDRSNQPARTERTRCSNTLEESSSSRIDIWSVPRRSRGRASCAGNRAASAGLQLQGTT